MSLYVKDYVMVSIVAFMISVVLTPFVQKKCQQYKQGLDFPNSPRKIHTSPIPRLGGIPIYCAFFSSLLLMFLTYGTSHFLFMTHVDVFTSLWLTSTLVFLVGLYDDFRGVSIFQKLTVQITAASLAYVWGFNIDVISIPFVGSVPLGILGFPVTLFWFVGVTNAVNFIDGVDGLASGVGFFSVSTIFMISLFLHHPLTAFFAAALAGSLFGFGLYNFNPASIFMGDSGSLFVGFTMAAISLQGAQKSSTAVVLLLPIVVLGVPITDTLLAIIRRIANGLSPFSADRDHIHHRLLALGFSSRQVTLTLYAVCCVLGVTALLMTAVNNQILTVLLVALSIMTIGGLKILGYTTDVVAINKLARQRINRRKRFLQRQRDAGLILEEVQMASDIFTLQKTILKYFEHMEFDVGRVVLIASRLNLKKSPSGKGLESVWYSPRYEHQEIRREQVWKVTMPLMLGQHACGFFEIGKNISHEDLLLDDMGLIEQLKNAAEHVLLSLENPKKGAM